MLSLGAIKRGVTMHNVIIGTAGHIDHGKTSLIRKLTGRETDRLKEEQERGITIDLGFTFFDLPSGRRAGIIDVPGHEKFIKNMLAGVSGVDFTILVIAADEGIMPQTEEHLDILSLLNVKKGLVVLTKKDLVDDDWLEYVKEEISNYVKPTFLNGAPIIPVSSVTGEGMEELIQWIDKLTYEIEERDNTSLFRVPIDRVFSIQGFGTVVTGTLIAGKIAEGDRVMVYPSKTETRIRSIQVHDYPVKEAFGGQRVAVNLAALKKTEVKRGDVLSCIDAMEPTMMLDIKLNLLSKCPREVENRDRLRLYHGTNEILCRIRLFDRDKLMPGETCYCQLRLEEPLVARRGDNYVLRFYSPMITIGGGTIVDAAPPKRKKIKEGIIDELQIKEKGDIEDVVDNLVLSSKGTYLTFKELIKLTGNPMEVVKPVINNLKDKERINLVNTGEEEYLIHSENINQLESQILELLKEHYNKHPLRSGLSKEEVKSKILNKTKAKLADKIIEVIASRNKISIINNIISSPDLKPKLTEKLEEMIRTIENKYLSYGLAPVKTSELGPILAFKEDILKEILMYLLETEKLVKLEEEVLIHFSSYQEAISKVKSYIGENGSISVAQFRDQADISRKQALLVLEYLDSRKITKRMEDKRVLY